MHTCARNQLEKGVCQLEFHCDGTVGWDGGWFEKIDWDGLKGCVEKVC